MLIKSKELNKETQLLTLDLDKIDLSLGRDLKKEMMARILKKYPLSIIDLKKVNFMDSSGLGVMIMAWQEAAKFKGRIVFISLSNSLKKLFSIARIDQFIEVFETLEQALQKKN